jgi:hypothetical protein
MAKGCVDRDADYCLYTIGLGSKDVVSCAVDAADLVITLGYDMVEYHPRLWNPDGDKGIVHIGFLPAEIDANHHVEVEIVGDLAHTLWMLNERLRAGATLLCGGGREGTMLEATLLENVPKDEDVVCQEAFGPVAVLSQFSDFDAALDEVNESAFGLQAGVFMRDLYKAHRAWDVLEVGGVVIGDVPSWRVDHMPYGGVKDSGIGREGIRWAFEDMTETRLMVIRTSSS